MINMSWLSGKVSGTREAGSAESESSPPMLYHFLSNWGTEASNSVALVLAEM